MSTSATARFENSFQHFVAAALFAALTAVASNTWARPPTFLPVQGVLSDADNKPIDGTLEVAFALYSSEQDGNAVWSGSQSVLFDAGYFTTHLGSEADNEIAVEVLLGGGLWLEIKIADDEAMARIQVGSVPYAQVAAMCSDAEALGGMSLADLQSSVVGDLGDKDASNPYHHDRYTDAESTEAMGALDNSNSYNHSRYGDADALMSMGALDNNNAYNHSRYSDAEALTSMGALAISNPYHHDRYSGTEAIMSMGVLNDSNSYNHNRYSDAEALTSMGILADNNPYNHGRYSDAEALSSMGPLANSNAYNHNRYADSEATAAMGTMGDNNAYNHARYTDTEAKAAVAAQGAYLPLAGGVVTGPTTFASNVTVDGGLTLNAPVHYGERTDRHGYLEFTTDVLNNNPVTDTKTYVLANIRCSGHWGSYAVEIDLVTYYYRPGVRRYTYFCGNSGNYQGGGVLTERTALNSGFGPGGLASLTLAYVGNSGFQQSGIDMHDAQIKVTQSPYVQTYLRVRAYGMWASKKAGTPLSESVPYVVWETWN